MLRNQDAANSQSGRVRLCKEPLRVVRRIPLDLFAAAHFIHQNQAWQGRSMDERHREAFKVERWHKKAVVERMSLERTLTYSRAGGGRSSLKTDVSVDE